MPKIVNAVMGIRVIGSCPKCDCPNAFDDPRFVKSVVDGEEYLVFSCHVCYYNFKTPCADAKPVSSETV